MNSAQNASGDNPQDSSSDTAVNISARLRLLDGDGYVPKKLKAGDMIGGNISQLAPEDVSWLVNLPVAAVVDTHTPQTRPPMRSYAVFASAGIPVIDSVDDFDALRDGDKLTFSDGEFTKRGKSLTSAVAREAHTVVTTAAHAGLTLVEQATAFCGNSIEVLQREMRTIVDGEGIPTSPVSMSGRHVVIVTGGSAGEKQLASLKPFIREFAPVLIGVDSGADVIAQAGHTVDVVVADPSTVSQDVLLCGAAIVLPAEDDGHCPGLERIQDLGVGAVTFPAALDSRNLAVLLADKAGADMIVVAEGLQRFDASFRADHSSPSAAAFMVDRSTGGKTVHASAIASLYEQQKRGFNWAIFLLIVLALVIAGVYINTNHPELIDSALDTWRAFSLWLQQLLLGK